MPRAIQTFNGQKSATVRFGFHGRDANTNEPTIGSRRHPILDGDKINVSLRIGDKIGVRFLGIDTLEKTLAIYQSATSAVINTGRVGATIYPDLIDILEPIASWQKSMQI